MEVVGGYGVAVGYGLGVDVSTLEEARGAGVGSWSLPKMPQARTTGRTSTPTASFQSATRANDTVFLSPISQALQVGT